MLKDYQKFIEITKIVKQYKLYTIYRAMLQTMYNRVDNSVNKRIYLNRLYKDFYNVIKDNDKDKLIKLLKYTKTNYLPNNKNTVENFVKLYFYQRK